MFGKTFSGQDTNPMRLREMNSQALDSTNRNPQLYAKTGTSVEGLNKGHYEEINRKHDQRLKLSVVKS